MTTRYFVYVLNPERPIFGAMKWPPLVDESYVWQDDQWVLSSNNNIGEMVWFGDPYLDEIAESELPDGISPL